MAEPVDQPRALAAGKRADRPWAAVVVLLVVVVAFVAGCHTGRGWAPGGVLSGPR